MNLPYKIKVAVVAGPQIVYAPIIGYAMLWAELNTGSYRRGDQVLHIAGDKRLHPGSYMGETPIVKRKDLPKGTKLELKAV